MTRKLSWGDMEVSTMISPYPLRHRCTEKDPWDKTKGGRATHPEAYEVGEQENGYPGGDVVTYKCPHCKHQWKEELPQ